MCSQIQRKRISAAGLAIVITWGLWAWDRKQTTEQMQQSSLLWGQYLSEQILMLALYGQEKGESSPVAWAVRLLHGGTKKGGIHLQPENFKNEDPTESYEFHPETRTLRYKKKFYEETGQGVQVQIQSPFLGFLGAQTPLENDLKLLFFFLILTGWILFLLKEKKSHPQTQQTQNCRKHREVLLDFGMSIKNLSQAGQNWIGMSEELTHFLIASEQQELERATFTPICEKLHETAHLFHPSLEQVKDSAIEVARLVQGLMMNQKEHPPDRDP